jgi:hypothetical protein
MRSSLSLAVSLSLALPSVALAAASPPPPAPVPLPGLVVTGPAVAEDVHVDVRCAGTSLTDASSLCRVVVHARLHAGSERVEVRIDDVAGSATTTIDGDAAGAFFALVPDQSVSIELAYQRDLSISTHDADAPWILPAPRARHLVLGESTSTHRSGDAASGELFGGQDVAIVGPIHVQADVAAVSVRIGSDAVTSGTRDVVDARGTIALAIDPGPDPDRVVQNGGPWLGAGVWAPLEGSDGGRFAMRVGYEIGIVDWIVASIDLETDFDSIAQSVLVEVATPELAILVPSISVGIGAVVRELGNRNADAALRVALGYQFACVGAYIDFDYWPSIDGWTLQAGGRLSI